MTNNRPAPALSTTGGEFPELPRSGSTGEPALVNGMPALRAASGSLEDVAAAAKTRSTLTAKPAAPIATEATGDDEVTAVLVQGLTSAVVDIQRPLPSLPETPRPHRRAFDSPDEYEAALIKWAESNATATATVETEKQRRAHGLKEAASALSAHQTERGLAEFPDYESVALGDHVPITHEMAAAIVKTPGGHRIAYALGKNPAEAARIAKLPPFDQAVEIGKLAARVAGTPAASKPRAASRSKTPAEMSMDEYASKRTPELQAALRPWHAKVNP